MPDSPDPAPGPRTYEVPPATWRTIERVALGGRLALLGAALLSLLATFIDNDVGVLTKLTLTVLTFGMAALAGLGLRTVDRRFDLLAAAIGLMLAGTWGFFAFFLVGVEFSDGIQVLPMLAWLATLGGSLALLPVLLPGPVPEAPVDVVALVRSRLGRSPSAGAAGPGGPPASWGTSQPGGPAQPGGSAPSWGPPPPGGPAPSWDPPQPGGAGPGWAPPHTGPGGPSVQDGPRQDPPRQDGPRQDPPRQDDPRRGEARFERPQQDGPRHDPPASTPPESHPTPGPSPFAPPVAGAAGQDDATQATPEPGAGTADADAGSAAAAPESVGAGTVDLAPETVDATPSPDPDAVGAFAPAPAGESAGQESTPVRVPSSAGDGPASAPESPSDQASPSTPDAGSAEDPGEATAPAPTSPSDPLPSETAASADVMASADTVTSADAASSTPTPTPTPADEPTLIAPRQRPPARTDGPEPGWYPSPDGVTARWWDGRGWTNDRRPMSEFGEPGA